jgi:LmbE family N-acetylglucosaminyl deacetylase
MLNRVLFLSPHRDDEILGAGGTLPQCNELTVMYFNYVHPLVEQSVYDSEAEAVRKTLQCDTIYSEHMAVNCLDQFPLVNFISEIEDIINWIKPTTVFIPMKSRNQDHCVIYNASSVALRPHDKNWFVPNVLIYEQSEYTNENFIPHVFIKIDIKVKLSLWNLYKSQHRGHRTKKHLCHLAGVRGMQCNVPYAEAFQVMRLS